ncbi:toll/interleukin-1 receptor domain-containing protein [uncultured Eubacterium sp.]|uniref:toll/interleukin-1 receptor domain-containing protein n=1 Tax=uncultured Eubacterium sp. TaxID=165185 RepID=UPI002598B8FA|nr:toll/interleukin-1 receptor domain-containing protein [uncultured Eubacterium sp.]
MGYAFISYSTGKQEYADILRKHLKQNNIKTWMAPEDIPIGMDYPAVINKAIKGCSCLVLILTEAAQESEWVKREVDRAINYKKPLFTILMDNVSLNDTFELFTSISQSISVTDNFESSEKKEVIVKSIGKYTGYISKLEHKKIEESEKENEIVEKEKSIPKQKNAYENEKEKKLTYSECMDLDEEYNKITNTFNIPDGYTYVTKLGLEPYSLHMKCLVIPKTVTYIDPKALKNCHCLEQIKVSKDNPVYEAKNKRLIEKATNTLIWKRY